MLLLFLSSSVAAALSYPPLLQLHHGRAQLPAHMECVRICLCGTGQSCAPRRCYPARLGVQILIHRDLHLIAFVCALGT